MLILNLRIPYGFAFTSVWDIGFDGKRLSIARDGYRLTPEKASYGEGILSFCTVEYPQEGQKVTTVYQIQLDAFDHIVGEYSVENVTATSFEGSKVLGKIEMQRAIVSPQ